MFFIGLLILVILVIIIIFAFPTFSPVPYYPSHRQDLSLIISTFNLHNNQTIVDLGAGDGRVIFSAATQALRQQTNTRFIAVEINPILAIILLIRRQLHPNKKNITVLATDFLKLTPRQLETRHQALLFYTYATPWLIDKIVDMVKQFPGKKTLISYFYPTNNLTAQIKKKGVNRLYVYQL